MTDRQTLQKEYDECKRQVDNLHKEIQKMRHEHIYKTDTLKPRGGKPIRTQFRIRRKLEGHYGKIYAVNWHQTEETTLVSASQDGKLIIWNAHSENKRVAIPLRSAWVMTCASSPSGAYVACGGLDNIVTIYNINENTVGLQNNLAPFRELQQHEGYISCCRFFDETHIASSSGDSTCIMWDIIKQKPLATFSDHTADVMNVSICRARHCFLTVSCDTTARLWDVRQGEKCIGNFSGHTSDVNTVDWFPDGFAFATGSDDASMRLFDTRAYRQLIAYSLSHVDQGVTSVKFSSSGKYLFGGYDERPFMVCWDTLNAVPTQDFSDSLFKKSVAAKQGSNRVSCLDVNCNGKAIVTGSWDCNLRIWA